jgi:hypothetical protein
MNIRSGKVVAPSNRLLVLRAVLDFCICCLLLVQAECTRSSVLISFEGLCGLTQKQFATMDKAALIQWIQEEYGVAPTQMGNEVRSGKAVELYAWTKDETDRYAWLQDGRLVWLSIERLNGPTFGQVVDALGFPEAVSRDGTGWENTVYRIGLEYPGLGFSVAESGVLAGYVSEITLVRDMHVNTVDCYAPGSMEDVLKNAYLIPPENVPAALSHRLPWTGFGGSVSLERR